MSADSSRKKNWSAGEISLLVDLVSERKDVLRGRFSPALTSADKAGAWEAITTSVNAVGGSGRTTKEVKKKWQDIQSSTKKKEAERKRLSTKTGGGPPPEDTKDWEKRIIGIISDKVMYGIDGGTDTLEVSTGTVLKACSESECRTSAQAVLPGVSATETGATCSTPTSAEGTTDIEPVVINTRKTLEDQDGSKRSKCEKQSSRKQKNTEDTSELILIQREMLDIMREDVSIKRKILTSLEELVTLKKIKLDKHLEEQTQGPSYFEL
ncbi:myb/SANT-like DNA-binding domain-containing protein 4 isoform X2 [Saccostrea cucullata]|uniref:myb/SANT-like DNA-binding domain-containing protein 4 isoform X2 n=1 Tax=Saccostrea cuccullata TaxID=36930 RepID=UPI002ED51DA9